MCSAVLQNWVEGPSRVEGRVFMVGVLGFFLGLEFRGKATSVQVGAYLQLDALGGAADWVEGPGLRIGFWVGGGHDPGQG